MKPWGFFIVTALFVGTTTMAQDLSIVDVRRHITLHDDDVVYKDFYINGGESDGLKKNLVITALRKIQVRDANGSQSFGEIQIPVGQLRVIATYAKVSVAREYKLLSRDELPMLEQTGLMNGDKIELKGSFIDNNKPVYKKKTAEAKPAAHDMTVVAAVKVASSGPAPASVPAVAPPAAPAAEKPKLEKTAEVSVPKAQ